jgi:broad specificity phosphatase PhoE
MRAENDAYLRVVERLILARHAESVFNVRGVLNGDPSVPGGLTERGRAQARRLGQMLADEPIDLCVTTAFERTRDTADLAFADRTIPRLIVSTLDDPPNGDFELRPAGELTEWRQRHGPDAPIPGTGRSEREHILAMLPGATLLLSRPEATVVAILHGWFVSWIAAAASEVGAASGVGSAKEAGDTDPPSGRRWQTPEHASPQEITDTQLERVVEELRRDPYRFG